METSGFDPEIAIRKIAVLPVKLYPLYSLYYIYTRETNWTFTILFNKA